MEKPKVFVVVRGGVADFVSEGDVDVEIFDMDRTDEEIISDGKISKEFSDLAKFCGIGSEFIEE